MINEVLLWQMVFVKSFIIIDSNLLYENFRTREEEERNDNDLLALLPSCVYFT